MHYLIAPCVCVSSLCQLFSEGRVCITRFYIFFKLLFHVSLGKVGLKAKRHTVEVIIAKSDVPFSHIIFTLVLRLVVIINCVPEITIL